MPIVPNLFPTVSAPYKIAICGEAPGADEEAEGKPFVGRSGKLLNALLDRAGLLRDALFIGNVCGVRPPENNLATFDWEGPEIQSGITALLSDLQKFNPNLIVCQGNTALHLFKEGNVPPRKRKDKKEGIKFVYPNSIEKWRGSRFKSKVLGLPSSLPESGTKCLATHHPAYCLHQWEHTEILGWDFKRAFKEGFTPHLTLPQREITIATTPTEVAAFIFNVISNNHTLACDIEGYWDGWSCLSLSHDPWHSFVIPLFTKDGSSCWSAEQECLIIDSISTLMSMPHIPKVWQNGLYDRWVLQYGYHIPVFGNRDDTMLKWWEKYCELEKKLSMQTSILTDEPFYKDEGDSVDDKVFFFYCGKDSAVTSEINGKLDGMLPPESMQHYRFNHTLLNLFLYIELRGMLYDKKEAKRRLAEVEDFLYNLQAQLDDLMPGYGIPRVWGPNERELEARRVMCYVRDCDEVKADYTDIFPKVIALCRQPTLTSAERGFLSVALKLHFNTKGADFRNLIYKSKKQGGLGYPPQYNKDTGAISVDGLALRKCQHHEPNPILDLAIDIAFLRTRLNFLNIKWDGDSRIRTSYNLVGTDTGRISSSTGKTGSGYNLQTFPDTDKSREPKQGEQPHPLYRGHRDLILPDPGHVFFNCDLKGSDGWTIGAHLARLGDSTMLEDLRAGIKPAARICYMSRHGTYSLHKKPRAEVKELLKEVKGDDPDYFALKVGIWGMCLTGEHEVLTSTGWTRFDQLQGNETIATWQADATITWEQPELIKQVYTGFMHHFHGQSFDLYATADHRMPYITNGNLKVTTAGKFSFKDVQLPKAGHWQGSRAEPLAKFYAMVMSDGHYHNGHSLLFNFRKSRKIERCKAILTELKIAHNITEYWSKRDNCSEYRIQCYEAPIIPKRAGAFMLEWDEASLRVFMDEYPYWDGMHTRNNCRTIFSADKDHIEWLATFQALSGGGYTMYTSTSDKGSLIYNLKLNNRSYASYGSMERDIVPVLGLPVYCLSTQAGFFLVRRNGKIMVTGNCYLMGVDLLRDVIFNESDGKNYPSRAEVKEFKEVVFKGYSLDLWHKWMAGNLDRRPTLTSAGGNTRKFFGRPTEVLGKALAHEPQANTTYATNMAAYNLWMDKENRVERVIIDINGKPIKIPFRAEPLHQVHDSLNFQCKTEDTVWAINKVKQWFNNPLMIAGIPITIPFSGKYGTSWGRLDTEF